MTDLHKQTLSLLAYLFLRHDRLDQATILYQALHRLYPEDAVLAASLAYVRLEQGDHAGALELAESAGLAASGPLASGLDLIRARALHGLDQKDEAWKAMRRTITDAGGRT